MKFGIGVLMLSLLLLACGETPPQTSSESHWVSCATDERCLAIDGAAGCGEGGLCVDIMGEPVSVMEHELRTTRLQTQSECDLRIESEDVPLELGRVLAQGRDERGTLWVIDSVIDEEAPQSSPGGNVYLAADVDPQRVFRLTDRGLERQRARPLYGLSFLPLWPEVESEYSEVLQLEVTTDPGVQTFWSSEVELDSWGAMVGDAPFVELAALADAEGNVVLGSPRGEHSQAAPVASDDDLSDVFSAADPPLYESQPVVDYPRYRRVHLAFEVEGAAVGATRLFFVESEGSGSGIVLVGEPDSLVQRRVIDYRFVRPGGTPSPEPGADLGRQVASFWLDGQRAEVVVPYLGTGDGGAELGDLSFTLDGEPQDVRPLAEPDPDIDLGVVVCLPEHR